MRKSANHVTLRSTCAAIVLTLGAASSASALDAYWHGVCDNNWHQDRCIPGTSNWYSEAPPNGDALAVPDETAIFAPGAVTADVDIVRDTTIKTLSFTADAPLYVFAVKQLLLVDGGGIINRSGEAPRFFVENFFLSFKGAAKLRSTGAAPSAVIDNIDGNVHFSDRSRGGDAKLTNLSGGRLTFFDQASAEDMVIANAAGRNRITFLNRSTGGDADLTNSRQSRLIFNTTRPLTAGDIDNSGQMHLLREVLTVKGDFDQAAGGALFIGAPKGDPRGRLIVRGEAGLGGTLVVNGAGINTPGVFSLISAEGGRQGKFGNVRFTGFKARLRPRLAYTRNAVILRVGRKGR